MHDGFLLEVDPSMVAEAVRLLEISMEARASLLIKVGKTWVSLEPLHLEP